VKKSAGSHTCLVTLLGWIQRGPPKSSRLKCVCVECHYQSKLWGHKYKMVANESRYPLSGSNVELTTKRKLAKRGGTGISTATSQRQGPTPNSWLGSLSARSLHVLPVSAWVSSGCSGFPPTVRCIGHAKFSLRPTGAGVWRRGDFHSNFIAV